MDNWIHIGLVVCIAGLMAIIWALIIRMIELENRLNILKDYLLAKGKDDLRK